MRQFNYVRASAVTSVNGQTGDVVLNISGGQVFYATVDAIQEINKAITLPFLISDPNSLLVDLLSGGGSLYHGLDFYIDGTAVKWDGKRTDGLIASGDEIRFVYLSSPVNTYYVTLSFAQATAKQVVLAIPPLDPANVQIDVMNGGGALYIDRDFFISGNIISWAGGRLDAVLSAGDEIRISY